MSSEVSQSVSVSRTIDAPAGELFALLARTANHPSIDGSGMLGDDLSDTVLSGVGDVFTLSMHNEEMGAYKMRNEVVEYEADRRLAWEPVLADASRDDMKADIGNSAHYRWGYVLSPVAHDRTLVTEFFDCTRSPEWLQQATNGGEGWVDAMTASLENLEALARCGLSEAS